MAKDKKNDYDTVIEKTNETCNNSNGGLGEIKISGIVSVEEIKQNKSIAKVITEEKIMQIFSQPVKKGQPLSWGTINKKNK